MKIKIWLFYICIIFISTQAGFTAMSSANFSIKSSVMSSVGGAVTSTSFKSNSTSGQPLISKEPALSANFYLYTGFWYTMPSTPCIWNLEPDVGDGDVDGFDFYWFINPPFNAPDIESFGIEFGRIDCSN